MAIPAGYALRILSGKLNRTVCDRNNVEEMNYFRGIFNITKEKVNRCQRTKLL